jgi:hypothetical protein
MGYTAFHNNVPNCGISGCRKKRFGTATFFDNHYKGTKKNGQTKMKSPVKSLLSFISKSQAPGWIIFGVEYVKAKIQTEEFV